MEEIREALDRVWTPSIKKVFVATNHELTHPIIVGLREVYGDQLLLWDSFESRAGELSFTKMFVVLMC